MPTNRTTSKKKTSPVKEPRSKTRKNHSTALEKQGKRKPELTDTGVRTKTNTKTGSRERKGTRARSAKSQRPEPGTDAKRRVSRRSTAGKKQASRNGLESVAAKVEPSQRIDQIGARIAACLYSALETHARTHGLGRVTGPVRFDWGEVKTQELSPDIAFVSFDRWAPYRHVPSALTWHVVPELVVDIVRDTEETSGAEARLNDYFKAGVNRVWMVHPHTLKILDYRSPTDCRTLQFDDCIDGGTLLHDLQLPRCEVKDEASK